MTFDLVNSGTFDKLIVAAQRLEIPSRRPVPRIENAQANRTRPSLQPGFGSEHNGTAFVAGANRILTKHRGSVKMSEFTTIRFRSS